MAQQAPLSKSLSVQNSAACPLTLANGFTSAARRVRTPGHIRASIRTSASATRRPGKLTVQRDLPFAMQMTATYHGTKGTHGPQEILPNSYPLGEAESVPELPFGIRLRNVERKLDTRGGAAPIAAQAAKWICGVADVHLFEVDRRRCVFGRTGAHDGERAAGRRNRRLCRRRRRRSRRTGSIRGPSGRSRASISANCSRAGAIHQRTRDSEAARCWAAGEAEC